MTPVLLAVVVAVAGGAGAVCRYLLDAFVKAVLPVRFPLGTLIVNVTGSFLLGVVTGLVAGQLLPAEWGIIAGTGFLGGYTTFSTASFETVRLAQAGRWGAAVANGFGMLAASLLAVGAGLWLGAVL